MPKIEARNLYFSYGAKTPYETTALKNINLEINTGEFVALLGNTGSGKSTLAKVFSTLLKPTSGKIYFDGVDVFSSKKTTRNIRRKIGMVFQQPERQLFEENVYQDIAFGPRNMGLSGSEIKERIFHTCKVLNIGEDLLNKSPFKLSGGEKRQVAIATIMAMQPEILILDEPTAGLDAKNKRAMMQILKNYYLNNNKNIGIIFITHDIETIANIANKILILHNSELVFFENISKIFEVQDKLRSIGFIFPEISQIMSELNKKSSCFSKNIWDIQTAVKEINRYFRG